MGCYRCGSEHITLKGSFKNVLLNKVRIRLECKDCGYNFIFRDNNYNKKIPYRIRQKIIELYKTDKNYVRKYDRLKKPTYSTREIAEMFNVSRNTVYQIVRQ